MSLHFHWFLPTNGDGRDIVGGGHGVAFRPGLVSPTLAAQMAATFQRYSCASAAAGSTPHQSPGTPPQHDPVRSHVRSCSDGRRIVNLSLAERSWVPPPAPAHPNPEVDVMRIAVVTGNPKPASRTHGAALAVAGALSAALAGPGDPTLPTEPGPAVPGERLDAAVARWAVTAIPLIRGALAVHEANDV